MTRTIRLAAFGALIHFAALALVSAPALAAETAKTPPDFRVCKATFALCTIAACDPIPGEPNQVMCHCTVNDGYSVGSGKVACEDLEKERPRLSSRYYPTKIVAKCTEDRPWAFCLDSPCTVNENNPRAAECTCNLVNAVPSPPVSPWVVVTSTYSSATCTTGVVSSATVQDVETVTQFLGAQKRLPPFPIQWLPKAK
jgi:hypothetical protein